MALTDADGREVEKWTATGFTGTVFTGTVFTVTSGCAARSGGQGPQGIVKPFVRLKTADVQKAAWLRNQPW